MKPQMQTLLAPYVDALRQASGKTGDLKGYPLKVSITIAMGGEHCGAAKAQPQGASGGGTVANATEAATDAAESSTTSAAGTAAAQAAGQSAGGGIAGSIAGSAAGAFGSKLMGGLFAKKTPPPTKPDAGATTAAQAGKSVPLVELDDRDHGDQYRTDRQHPVRAAGGLEAGSAEAAKGAGIPMSDAGQVVSCDQIFRSF